MIDDSYLELRLYSGAAPKEGTPLTTDNLVLSESSLVRDGGEWAGIDRSANATGTVEFGRITRSDGSIVADLPRAAIDLRLRDHYWPASPEIRTSCICTGYEVITRLALAT